MYAKHEVQCKKSNYITQFKVMFLKSSQKIPMKDFGSEIRAKMDIDHLLNKAVLLLDLPETSLEEIFSKYILKRRRFMQI